MNKPIAHSGTFAQPPAPHAGCVRRASVMTGFIVTSVSILFCAIALGGIAIGFLLFKAKAIILASPLIALLAAAFVFHHGFGPVRDALIMAGSLTALQSAYLVGAAVRYLTMDERHRWRSSPEQRRESAVQPVARIDRSRASPQVIRLLRNHRRTRRQPHRNIGEYNEQAEQHEQQQMERNGSHHDVA